MRLAPQTIHSANHVITRDYLIPAGYYQEMWDWDSFFIGAHWANQNPADAKYLQSWVLNVADEIDPSGYTAGYRSSNGPPPNLLEGLL